MHGPCAQVASDSDHDIDKAPVTTSPLVLAVGPLPPPVNGIAVVHRRLAARVAVQAQVAYFDVGASLGEHWRVVRGTRRIWRLACVLVRFVSTLLRRRPQTVLISLSAGPAQCFDAACAWLASCAGATVYLHHHSFAYLMPGSVRWYHRLTFALLRPHSHIVLCRVMAGQLTRLHGVPRDSMTVLSNAAFVEPVSVPVPVPDAVRTTNFSVGFLSNIVESKGIFDYLDLLQTMHARHGRVTGLVAGAVAAEIHVRFAQRLAALPFVLHVGALGSAQEKADFFSRIDLLVFPSKHVHEAEPLVVAESLAHGVPVVATARGCLASVWAGEPAVQVFDEQRFHTAALAAAEQLMQSAPRAHARAAQARHRDLHVPAVRDLEHLVTLIVRGRPLKRIDAASATNDA